MGRELRTVEMRCSHGEPGGESGPPRFDNQHPACGWVRLIGDEPG
jgi:hypothetical protein